MAVGRRVARSAALVALGPLSWLRRAPGTAVVLVLLMLMLTALTQVGGVLLWLALPGLDAAARRIPGRRGWRLAATAGLFAVVYFAATLAVVPPLAAQFGRVPLPCGYGGDSAYGPLTRLFCLLNRHYATPAARDALRDVAARVAATTPGRQIRYLDAGFPFFAWFPMLPHLSHGDGRKVDIALPFIDPVTGRPAAGGARSPIGYWGYVPPRPGSPLPCDGRSSWRRWELRWLQPLLPELQLDAAALAALLNELAASPRVTRVFVEPHIGARVGIAHRKIRFQGCAAARHDDHIHVEFR